MLEIYVTVCLLAEPKRCKEVALTYLEDSVTAMQCHMGSLAEIAKWRETHPTYFAKRWGCRRARTFAKT